MQRLKPLLSRKMNMTISYGYGLTGDRKGTIAIMFALCLPILMAAAGAAVDTTRLQDAKIDMQNAVDESALAGASAYTDPTQASAAMTSANTYFTSHAVHEGATIVPGYPTVSIVNGTNNAGNSAYNVTVTAKAVMKNTFMAVFGYASNTITVSATASNPLLLPHFTTSSFGSQAADWNTVWMYAVPLNSSGQPNYLGMPASGLYQVASNCNAQVSVNWSTSSPCNGANPQTPVPVTTTMPTLSATQPMAFVLENVTGGLLLKAQATSASYLSNQYGSEWGGANWFASALPETETSPDMSVPYFHSNLFGQTTHSVFYPSNNCSLMVSVVDPNNLPRTPPVTGQCYANDGSAGGVQYASMTCNAMGGHTYMFWWNDMGGAHDDYDYNDAYYTVSCAPKGSSSSSSSTTVALIK
jgi:Flp pilus assembly protein TadG